MSREILESLKATAEAEKADWLAKLDESEKVIAQANLSRTELIGRANQAVGAIAALDKAIAALDAAASKE